MIKLKGFEVNTYFSIGIEGNGETGIAEKSNIQGMTTRFVHQPGSPISGHQVMRRRSPCRQQGFQGG